MSPARRSPAELGTPRVVMQRRAGFGRQTVDYEFGLGDYGLRLFGAPGRLRVVRVSTLLRRERTSKGIGPGSLERNLIRAYRGLRCQRLAATVAVGTTYVTADERTCTLFTASGRRTVFLTGVPQSAVLIRPAGLAPARARARGQHRKRHLMRLPCWPRCSLAQVV